MIPNLTQRLTRVFVPPTPDTAACDRCGSATDERYCKVRCDNCGATRDCSDP